MSVYGIPWLWNLMRMYLFNGLVTRRFTASFGRASVMATTLFRRLTDSLPETSSTINSKSLE